MPGENEVEWPTQTGAVFTVTREMLHARVWADPMTPEEKAEKEAEIRRIMKRERRPEIDARLRFAWTPRLYDFFPSANLVLKIDGWVQSAPRKSWKDSPRQKLVLKLGDIIGGIEQYAQCSNQENERRAIEAAHRAEEARKREEAGLRALAEAKRREELLTEAGAADTARQIRQFVESCPGSHVTREHRRVGVGDMGTGRRRFP